jgi:hypothetical protein
MSVGACAGDNQFVTTDFPVVTPALHVGFVSGPENKVRVFAGDEMQCLHIGAGASTVAADSGKSGSEHVLCGTVFIKRSPDIVDPLVAVSIGLIAKTDDFNVLLKAGQVPGLIPLIHSGGVGQHNIL